MRTWKKPTPSKSASRITDAHASSDASRSTTGMDGRESVAASRTDAASSREVAAGEPTTALPTRRSEIFAGFGAVAVAARTTEGRAVTRRAGRGGAPSRARPDMIWDARAADIEPARGRQCRNFGETVGDIL